MVLIISFKSIIEVKDETGSRVIFLLSFCTLDIVFATLAQFKRIKNWNDLNIVNWKKDYSLN